MANERLRAWIRQARADLGAAQCDAGEECHRRYWLQQACEKCIKALGIILWSDRTSDEGHFRGSFLNKHSPLQQLSKDVASDPALPSSLRMLLRQIDSELSEIDGGALIRQVDATTPTLDPTRTSYRYPFQDEGKDVAPADWTTSKWDAYQGNVAGVVAAIERFLRAIEKRRLGGRGG